MIQRTWIFNIIHVSDRLEGKMTHVVLCSRLCRINLCVHKGYMKIQSSTRNLLNSNPLLSVVSSTRPQSPGDFQAFLTSFILSISSTIAFVSISAWTTETAPKLVSCHESCPTQSCPSSIPLSK